MIFLDNNSTTKPDEEALGAAAKAVVSQFFNPSAPYAVEARYLLAESRSNLAKSLGCLPENVIFTSSGTESNNLAMHTVPEIGELAICSEIEHASVYNCAVEKIKVTSEGFIDLNHLEDTVKKWSKWAPRKVLGVMSANNETGVILDPNNEVPDICLKYDLLLHIDAVQSFGKVLDFDLSSLKADTVAISGHKVHAIKGIGALYVRPGCRLSPMMRGGHHEFGLRAGTENQMGIVDFGIISKKFITEEYKNKLIDVSRRRDLLEELLKSVAETNGSKTHRVCNTSNLYFPDILDSDILVDELYENGVATSTRSACASGMPVPSHTLTAMYGKDNHRATKSVRFSLSVDTTDDEICKVSEIVKSTLQNLKNKGV